MESLEFYQNNAFYPVVALTTETDEDGTRVDILETEDPTIVIKVYYYYSEKDYIYERRSREDEYGWIHPEDEQEIPNVSISIFEGDRELYWSSGYDFERAYEGPLDKIYKRDDRIWNLILS